MANNNNNNNPQATFWDFFQPDPRHGRGGAGQGAEHMFGPNPSFPQAFPFDPSQFGAWAGNGQWGPWGGPFGKPWGHDQRGHRHGPSAGADEQHPEDDSTETMRPTPDSSEGPSDEDGQPPRGFAHPPPPPPAEAHPPPPPPPAGAHPPPPHPAGPYPPPPPPPFSRPHHPFGPGPHRGRGGRGGPHGRGGFGGPRGRPGPPPAPFTGGGPFDLRSLMQAFAGHPFAQALRDYVDQAATATGSSSNEQQDEEDKFIPPVDIFNTENTYVLHFALPGASKEDIGVHWDSEKSSVIVAGVVYRPGNEELLQGMISNERKVGMFERSIELPPAGSDKKEEVDGFGITAKMENGILIITVPKVEKDSWTEIHKIDVD